MKRIHLPWQTMLVLLVLSLILPATSVRAQETGFAAITVPDTEQFPLLITTLDVFDGDGNFANGLTSANLAILENGESITPDKVEKLQPPLNFVLAVNSDPALALRDGLGISRYEKITAVLSNWASNRPDDSQDKLALVWNGGIIASRLDAKSWKTRLESFDIAPRESKSSLAALTFALDAIQEAGAEPGSKKAILLVSGHLGLKDQGAIDDLVNRAKQAEVRIYVWITDSPSFQENPGSLALQTLADATGGQYVNFTGIETLPDPEEWFSTLRNLYRIYYQSGIREGGLHSISIQVTSSTISLTSPAVPFSLDIQPPSAALLSPPFQILRQNQETPFDLETFMPRQQEISILIEFPDGRIRDILRTALFVDGEKVAENTSEPFTQFTWDLSKYSASADHALQVEVEDVLGLSRLSAEVPVQVMVQDPPGGIPGLVLRNRAALTITFVVITGAIVISVLILGGRKGLASLSERRKTRAALRDPVSQPVPVKMETPNRARANPFPWIRQKTPPPPAYFVRLTADGSPGKGDPIPLSGREITFGTDPTQATIVLGHPSLSLLHARLLYGENELFTLLDQGSVAGTWVNFDIIPPEGCVLKHGDVIHLGQLTYRFVLVKPPVAKKPTITHIKNG